jgi:hypothetical protein
MQKIALESGLRRSPFLFRRRREIGKGGMMEDIRTAIQDPSMSATTVIMSAIRNTNRIPGMVGRMRIGGRILPP